MKHMHTISANILTAVVLLLCMPSAHAQMPSPRVAYPTRASQEPQFYKFEGRQFCQYQGRFYLISQGRYYVYSEGKYYLSSFTPAVRQSAYTTSAASPPQPLVSDAPGGNLQVINGRQIGVNPLVAAQSPVVAAPPPKQEHSCLEDAVKGGEAAIIATGILVFADCVFTGCAFTMAALTAGTGGIATAVIVAKGTAIVATGAAAGCAKALVN